MWSREMLEKWCVKHNGTLLYMTVEGIVYQTHNGMIWHMPYSEL